MDASPSCAVVMVNCSMWAGSRVCVNAPVPHLVLSCCPPERVREHQPHHVGGQPAAGVGPLRLAADQADLQSAGEGVEGVCGGAGRAQHAAGHVGRLPPEVRPGEFPASLCILHDNIGIFRLDGKWAHVFFSLEYI